MHVGAFDVKGGRIAAVAIGASDLDGAGRVHRRRIELAVAVLARGIRLAPLLEGLVDGARFGAVMRETAGRGDDRDYESERDAHFHQYTSTIWRNSEPIIESDS